MVTKDTNANGAQEDTSADTVDECTDICLSKSECVAFDYDTVNNKCWIHTVLENIAEDKRNSAPGIDFYQRFPCSKSLCFTVAQTIHVEKRCLDARKKLHKESTTNLNPDRLVLTLRHSILRKHLTLYNSAAGCPDGADAFEKMVNTNADGAIKVPEINTLEECRSHCLSQADCVAFDYNRGSSPEECWIHSNAEDVAESRGPANDVDHYLRKPCGNIRSRNKFDRIQMYFGRTHQDSFLYLQIQMELQQQQVT